MVRHHRARLPLAAALVATMLGLAAAPAQAEPLQAPQPVQKTKKTVTNKKEVKKPKKPKKVDCAKVKCIALTFDDGPGKYADKLLDTLKKHESKATFFLEGQYVKSRKEFAKRIVAEGHQIGNHSYTHPNMLEIGEDEIRQELQRTEDIIYKVTGKRSTLLRPPYGLFDERYREIAVEMGLPIVLWNGGSRDWDTQKEGPIYKEVMRSAKRDGVILMHDWVKATVDVMPRLLKDLKKQGYHMVTVSELLRDGRKLQPGEVYPEQDEKEWEELNILVAPPGSEQASH